MTYQSFIWFKCPVCKDVAQYGPSLVNTPIICTGGVGDDPKEGRFRQRGPEPHPPTRRVRVDFKE